MHEYTCKGITLLAIRHANFAVKHTALVAQIATSSDIDNWMFLHIGMRTVCKHCMLYIGIGGADTQVVEPSIFINTCNEGAG